MQRHKLADMLSRLRPLHLALFAIFWQGLSAWAAWQHNPFARLPVEDAAMYWDWANRIADGEWVGETPFLSAPLYPYFLGLLRAVGLGLPGILAAQTLLHGATVFFIADAGRRHFNLKLGMAGGLLYLLCSEPTFYAARLLNPSVQLFTVALLLWLIERQKQKQIAAGLGLSSLANPAMLLTVPFFAWWSSKENKARVQFAAIALLVISPAALHNFIATSRSTSGAEFIPISAQAGVTYFHGNAPGAVGIYNAIPGVSASRLQQNADAFAMASEAAFTNPELGKPGWGFTSSYFFQQGLSFLASDPFQGLLLHGRKLAWLMTSVNYGDVYQPALEASDDGFGSMLATLRAPIRTAMVIWLALPAVFLLWRRRRDPDAPQARPFLMLFLMPALVVLIFWYAPRYRMPILPIAAFLVPWGMQKLAEQNRGWLWAALFVAALIPGVNSADSTAPFKAQYEHSVGATYRVLADGAIDGTPTENTTRLKNREELLLLAEKNLRQAIFHGYDNATSHFDLAQTLMKRELWHEAVDELKATLGLDPQHPLAARNLKAIQEWLQQNPQ